MRSCSETAVDGGVAAASAKLEGNRWMRRPLKLLAFDKEQESSTDNQKLQAFLSGKFPCLTNLAHPFSVQADSTALATTSTPK